MKRTIYYSDMMNDDFADNGIKRKKLPRDYQYISKDPLRRTADFMLHHFVATPIAYIFQKVVYCEKIVNRKVLQPYLINGFYIYGKSYTCCRRCFHSASHSLSAQGEDTCCARSRFYPDCQTSCQIARRFSRSERCCGGEKFPFIVA